MRRTASLFACLLSGRQLALIASTVCVLLMTPIATAQHSPGKILYKRTDGLNVAGDAFTGALPENTDYMAPFGVPDDPGSSLITEINVDREPGGGGIDLTGDNHDLAFTFQFHDADGVFSFTENYDDGAQIVITPITGPNDLTSTGAARTHADLVGNSRTNGSFDFGAGGWFNADIRMTEDGGGAQSAADIGFGYSNEESDTVGLQQISPNPTSYFEVVSAGVDPAPPGMDFTRFNPANSPVGDVTAPIQQIPGVGDVGDFGEFVAGNIALIDRGAIRFDAKVTNAEANGAVGAIIANTFPSAASGLFQGGGEFGTTNIPAVMIRHGLGVDLKAQLDAGENVVMRIATVPPPPPTQFGGIGYTSTFGISSGAPAVFDPDPANNNWSFGAYLDSFDPTIDTDGDGIPDGFEELFFPGDLTKLGPGDFDNDGLADKEEFDDGTDPTKEDTDDDGLTDRDEKTAGSDPHVQDSDGDTLSDGDEVNTHSTDPTNADSDGDGWRDDVEIENGSNPNSAASQPRFPAGSGRFIEIIKNDTADTRFHLGEIEIFAPGVMPEGMGGGNGGLSTDQDLIDTLNLNASAYTGPGMPSTTTTLEHGANTTQTNNNLEGGGGVWSTANGQGVEPRYVLDLGETVQFDLIRLWARNDDCCEQRFENLIVNLYTDNGGEPGIIVSTAEFPDRAPSGNDGPLELSLGSGALTPPSVVLTDVSFDATTDEISISWESSAGELYNVRSEVDPSMSEPTAWPIFGGLMDIEATPPINTVTFALPPDPTRLFVVESFPAPPEEIFFDDFENGAGAWTTGGDPGSPDTGDPSGPTETNWELGTPANVGPPSAFSGSNAWGTNVDARYVWEADVFLRSPVIDLTDASGATLVYQRFVDIEVTFDRGIVAVLDASDDSEIAVLETDIDGLTGDWEEESETLPAEALGKMIKIEFRLQSDDFDASPFAGFYVDDVRVTVP